MLSPGGVMRRVLALLIAASLALTPTLVVAQTSGDAPAADTAGDEAPDAAATDAETDAATDAGATRDAATDEAAATGLAPVLTAAPPRRDRPGDEIAIGVVAGTCFIAGASFLVVASNRRDELDRVQGTTLYANEQRRILEQQDEGNRMLGYSLIGVGLLASAGLAVLIHDDGPELSVAPSASRRGGGLAFGARF